MSLLARRPSRVLPSTKSSPRRHSIPKYRRPSPSRHQNLRSNRPGYRRVKLHRRNRTISKIHGSFAKKQWPHIQAQHRVHGYPSALRQRQGHRDQHWRKIRVRRSLRNDASRGSPKDSPAA
ncbi:hypothetical protein G9C98_007993 [Cotesia typhae]|uniref:Uncharacterized protein n=1 Tax=Cotesia typhae TaxID=2053667 RepID=A0A8J5QTE3_9HYME|nr:hypothetical protein G9C98_007993 [Cotesia typhae]